MSVSSTKPIEVRNIIERISLIPLISYKIIGGDLDTFYSVPRFRMYDRINTRIIVLLLTDLARSQPDELRDLDYHANSSLEHFIGTIKTFENDRDVQELLEMLKSENLKF